MDGEQLIELTFPPRGLDLARGFAAQSPDTAPDARNVRLFEPSTGRARGGSRPGLSQFIPEQLPSGSTKVQDLNVVVSTDDGAVLDNYDWGDGDGEDAFDAIPDPSGPGWFYGPYDPLDADDPEPFPQDDPGWDDLTPAQQQAILARLRPRNGTRTGGDDRLVRPGGSARQPTWQRRKGTPEEPEEEDDIVLVQSKGLLSPSDSFDLPVTAGNLLVVGTIGVNLVPGSAFLESISDTLGSAWTQVGSVKRLASGAATENTLALWYALAPSTGTCTVSVTPVLNRYFFMFTEWSGVAQINALDSTSSDGHYTQPPTLSNPVTMTTGTVPASAVDELLLGVFYYTTGHTVAPVVGSGFTQITAAGGGITRSAYKVGPTAAEAVTYLYSRNSTLNSGWAAIGATFRPGA